MKAGTESKGKTIFAAVFMVIAVAIFVYMFFLRGDSGSDASAPAGAAGGPAQGATAGGTARPATAARARTRRDKAPLGLKVEQSLDPRLNIALLDESEKITYAGTGRNIFEMQAEAPIPTPVKGPEIAQPQPRITPPPPPGPPPIPLKFYGWANKSGDTRSVFLSSANGDVFVAKEGEIVDRRYKVVKINPGSVEMEDVLTNFRQNIPLTQQITG
jgi:hypothetical protein